MTDQVTPPTDPTILAAVPETPKKRKLPSRQTVVKYAKITLMVIGGATVVKKGSELLNKEVSVDFNAEITDPDEAPEND